MRVLVTGGAGFIGHHIVRHLLAETDWSLTILDRLDCSGNLNRLAEIGAAKHPRVRFVYHDLRGAMNEQVIRQVGQHDYILHLAASTHVDRSLTDPMGFVYDNVIATGHLLEFARATGCEKFINFSTDEVFGPAPLGYAHTELDRFAPSNPYSGSKAGAVALGYAWWVSFGVPVLTTYTMNNFGERQHPEKLIPRTVKAIREGTAMPIFAMRQGDTLVPVGSRYWLHAANTASAVTFLLQHGQPGEGYNIIGFDEWQNWDLVHRIAAILDRPLKADLVDFYGIRPGHDPRYALDGSKLRDMGWTPPLAFDAALEQTVRFTLEHPEWA